jgi:hypothetical protein
VGPTCHNHLLAVAGPVHACGSGGARAADRDTAPTWMSACTETERRKPPCEAGVGVQASGHSRHERPDASARIGHPGASSSDKNSVVGF